MNENTNKNKNNKLYVCYSLTTCKKDDTIGTTNEIKQEHKVYKIAVSNEDKAVKWVNDRREEYAEYGKLKTKAERNSFLKKHPLLEATMLYGNDVGYEELEVLE